MPFDSNLDCLINSRERNLYLAVQSVGIRQIGQNTRFVF